jgi:ABC-type Fe3+/spermidine/putrescine transport system ATPase subunit
VSLPILQFEAVSKRYGRVQALDHLSLTINEGEVFTLLGPSGCGKTTTLRIIAGLEEPSDGRLLLRGTPLVSRREGIFVPPNKRNLGMVFQSYAIWPHKTVYGNVAYPLEVRRCGRAETRQRVASALALVGLDELEERPASMLSGGQQQRVALARALVHEPSILLLDEPFSNLDAKLREQMRLEVKLLQKKLGITVVFVTHDQVEALTLSNRVALMNHGRVEQVDTPEGLYYQPTTPFVRDFLGKINLLHGHVVESTPPVLTVTAPGVLDTPLRLTSDGFAVAAGATVRLAIRPESLTVDSNRPACASGVSLPGRLETLQFTGDRYECTVRLANDDDFLCYLPRAHVLREDQLVWVRLAVEDLTVWPT